MTNGVIKKAVFPVAGLGTRFLPATKACPKEMLPIVDKPLIQYAVEEAADAGITDMIFVTGSSKRAIEDHFDRAGELERQLQLKEKNTLLNEIKNIPPKGINCVYIRQSQPLGLGHAVFCAKPAVGNEPFAVILADDLMIAKKNNSVIKQMIDQYENNNGSIVAVETVAQSQTEKYGIVKGEPLTEKLSVLSEIVEKPKPINAPSNIAVVGRYILSSKIFSFLSNQVVGSGGEIQLTDAIAELIKIEKVFAYNFDGIRYDCGSKQGYLQATVKLALSHPKEGNLFLNWLKKQKLV